MSEHEIDVVLCGPPMTKGGPPMTKGGPPVRLKLNDLSEADAQVIADFGAFLGGKTDACPVCMAPMTRCTLHDPCCERCPGWHVTTTRTRTEVAP